MPNAYLLYRIKNGKSEYAPTFCIKLKVKTISIIHSMNLMKLMTPNSTIQLNKQRIEKHITIKPVASIIGVSVDTITRIEQNKYSLHNADKFRKLCDILDLEAQKICSPCQLFPLNNQGEQILKFRKDNHSSL